jgi:murein L,D-transpeptidase YafK
LKIEKSRFLLTVLYRGKPLKSYPVVLGANPVDDKLREGDNCTPEGEFKIVEVRSPHKWSRFMLLNYPTSASRTRFLTAQKRGDLPAGATIGSAIGIHGVPKGFDSAIDARENWTAGCIALKTADINEIYSVCRRGTAVRIVH